MGDTPMSDVRGLINGYVAEARVDFVGLWQIAQRVRVDGRLCNWEAVRDVCLQVVYGLIDKGLQPGDYDMGGGFSPWSGAKADSLARIRLEWDALRGPPTILHPICWLRLMPPT